MTTDTHELILLRHAEARAPRGKQDDFDRVLSARGEADAERLGTWLRQQEWIFDLVYCSPAARTRSTLASVLPFHALDARLLPDLYLADAGTLQRIANEIPAVGRALLLAHNPGLEQFANALCGWSAPRALPTCGLLRLRREADGTARLIESWQP
ncbi:MAG: SixA phosphatase family protein [Metallibacterium sp.]|jgi:phosphohistidine phosphatase